jgi:hypothetical protein
MGVVDPADAAGLLRAFPAPRISPGRHAPDHPTRASPARPRAGAGRISPERGRISTDDTTRALFGDSTKHFEQRLVFGTRPTFTVIEQDPLPARRVRMVSVGGSTIGGEVRLRAGPVGSDPPCCG